MRRITFDIETTGESGVPFDFSNQELTVVGVHDSETDQYTSYVKEELPQMWPLFERADILVGYNSDHFDIPILNKYYAGDLTKIKSIDLLKEIKNVLGRRLKLDSVAQATLGTGKIAAGLDAVKWWKEGNIEKVREYCLDDVRITKEIYDYARQHGSLKYKDYEGVREIKLNTSKWEEVPNTGAITHTLPF
ncbi:MAG TPA: ribonuclease H-like domain-containing protein [Candidatus Paceibacterota bacterium]|nr:ribonuclease H-like domain-containing protein [Candidatus Paceibacterota bacterium]